MQSGISYQERHGVLLAVVKSQALAFIRSQAAGDGRMEERGCERWDERWTTAPPHQTRKEPASVHLQPFIHPSASMNPEVRTQKLSSLHSSQRLISAGDLLINSGWKVFDSKKLQKYINIIYSLIIWVIFVWVGGWLTTNVFIYQIQFKVRLSAAILV